MSGAKWDNVSRNKYSDGWKEGVAWAKQNWYNSDVGKNCDGGKLGAKLASIGGLRANGFAEGVRYALSNPEKV